MYYFPCFNCGNAVRVLEATEESEHLVGPKSEFWPHSFECPVCEAKVSAGLESDFTAFIINSMRTHDLTAQEAFLAFNGAGMPDELLADEEEVGCCLLSGVVAVTAQDIPNTDRCVIHKVHCANGKTLFLGASPHGAVVYRVKNKHSYVQKAVAKEAEK